jgi:hypothetical protein
MAGTVSALSSRDPRTDRARLLLCAAALALAPILLALGTLISPDTGDKAAKEVATIAAHRGQFLAGTLLFALGAAALIPGTLALAQLARARGAAFMTTGAAMIALGGGCLAVALGSFGIVGYVGTEAGVPRDGLIAFVDHADNSALFGALWVIGVGSLIGMIVCAIGLLRARTVPRWEAILLIVAPPLAFFGNSGVLGAVLGLPLIVALVALAYEIVRSPMPAEIDLTDGAADADIASATPTQRERVEPATSRRFGRSSSV